MDCITYRFWTVISSQPLGEGHVSLTSVTVILVCWVYGHRLIPCCGASIILRWSIAFPFQVLFFVILLVQELFWITNTGYKIVFSKSHFASYGFGFVQHLLFLCQITVCPIQPNFAWFCTKHVPPGYGSQIPQSGITCVQQQLLLIAFYRIVASHLRQTETHKSALHEPMFHGHCLDQVDGVTSSLEFLNSRCDVNLCSLWVITCLQRFWLPCSVLHYCESSLPFCIVLPTGRVDEKKVSLLHCFADSLPCWHLFWNDCVFLGTLPSLSKSYKNEGISIKPVCVLFAAIIRFNIVVCQRLLRATLPSFALCTVRRWFLIHNHTRQLTLSWTFPRVHILNHIARSCEWSFRFSLVYRNFDSTLGYPGEGPGTEPENHQWKCISANIDSIQSNIDFLNWNHDICLLQETRLSNLNFDTNLKTVKKCGKHIFPGGLLKEKADKNGTFKTPHGGCAILAPQATTRAFESKDDATGLWDALHRTTRVSAVWHQISKNTRVLCFSFYGHSGVNDNNNLEVNDHLIDNILTVCSQFGDVPIIFSGDFQADPDQYHSISCAKHTGVWFDPLVSCDADGSTHRPITYSRNSDFINPKEHFSSIDAMLVNSTALAALKQMRVCHEHCRPHAPIEATFEWSRLCQTGYILRKPAAFDFTSIAKINDQVDHSHLQEISEKIWDSKYKSRFQNAPDETAWKYINNLGRETLIAAGAKFGDGPKTRGQPPTFEKKTVFPGQNSDECAFTDKSLKLAKTHKLVTELRFRFQRQQSGYADFVNTFNLQHRVAKALSHVPECKWWKLEQHCYEEAIVEVQKCLQKAIVTNRAKEKRQRISNWKQKMINGTKSKNVSKFIYKWLRNKTQPVVPNLIRNANGDILFSPIEAISEINDQWDTVFSANALHHNPHQVLSEIWPIVSRIRNPTSLPILSGTMLQKQASSRRIDAAAGIDGWRTIETKTLPLQVYDLIAEYFRDVENGFRQLPSILTTARQIILHKGGDDVPLQKRLISLLPIFMITYTSLRFKQLQHWQITTLPKNLFGGIQSRKMSQLQMHLRLTLDDTRQNNHTLIGVKLDKSKCFDRLLPDVSSAILLGLGVPQTTLRVFASLYGNLKRFLSYQSWTSHISTTCANGVIQGCSFSLLAVNAHMTVWSAYLAALPGICAAAYIDDCYIWTKLENNRLLQQAMTITSTWDTLTGQLANHRKSVAWATNLKGRRLMKAQYPETQHQQIVEILGVSMQTTLQKSTGWDKAKTAKAIRDLKLIRALPCSRDVHSHIASVKVIPQISFSPHLNHIPKCDLQTIQDGIADLLWKNRPMWRSRGLVLSLLANPCRVDPFTARAVRTIAECVQYLKLCENSDREKWRSQCGFPQPDHAAVPTFRRACHQLGLVHTADFFVSFCNSEPLCFLDFSFRELRKFLEAIARHSCYEVACKASRKDLYKSNGILDFHVTNLGANACKGSYKNGLELRCFRDSSVVGCSPTNDRRVKAGTSDTNMCRYCGEEVETLKHLLCSCNQVTNDPKLICPQHLGPNFELLGIAEIPLILVRDRLKCSNTSTIPVTEWQNPLPEITRVWTDGSCYNPHLFWHMKGGFSVVDQHGKCLLKGRVKHISMSSYTCELWAVIRAFAQADGPIIISSDNETVVKQTKQMIAQNEVQTSWQHFQWWAFFLHILNLRKCFARQPLQIRWIPAHLLESLPCELISNQAAREAGSTWLDIFCNRKADAFAKECVSQEDVDSHISEKSIKEIKNWQTWLATLNAQLSADESQPAGQQNRFDDYRNPEVEVTKSSVVPHEISLQHPIDVFKSLLPKWIWAPNPENFQWISEFPGEYNLSSYANISNQNWLLALNFLKSLRWAVGPSYETAYMELAFYFWFLGHRFLDTIESPSAYCRLLRKAINQAFKTSESPLVPGTQHSKCKCKGRVLPAGTLINCYPLIEPNALKHLAFHVLHGRQHTLASWDCSF